MEKLLINVSINANKEVVMPVQSDVENIALWTDQDNYTIYFEPIFISPTVELIYSEEKNGWVFRSR